MKDIRSIIERKNKKGGIGIIVFFIILMLIILIGFGLTMIWGVIDIASDEITPIMTELGMVGDVNVSQAAEYSFGVVNTIVQATPWLIALGYVLALIFTLVFVFIVGYNPHPAFMAFYFILMVLILFLCIIVSNMYQDIYTGDDELALRLQEQTTMSYMILHSPIIIGIITMIGGVLMFTRQSSAEGSLGGFGV